MKTKQEDLVAVRPESQLQGQRKAETDTSPGLPVREFYRNAAPPQLPPSRQQTHITVNKLTMNIEAQFELVKRPALIQEAVAKTQAQTSAS